jgi:signal transduction histidine kinase
LLKKEVETSNAQLLVEMEHAKESDRLKSAFLANLSHEIRTPMNAIIGFSELIQMEEVENERIEKYGKYVIENSYFLQNLINDIVDISLIESGQVHLVYDFHHLKRLFAEIEPIIDASPFRSRRPKVSINFIGKDSLLLQPLYLDALHLKQVLINLVTNALKYTEKGFILIRVKEADGLLEFCVQDTGIGIPVDEQPKIFNRFTKIERMGKTVPGIGIGLSICKGLVLAMKGQIWFESDENNGTKFFFTLPYSTSKIN